MVKASEGGGGKGIRKVNCADDFPNLFRQASGGLKRDAGLGAFLELSLNVAFFVFISISWPQAFALCGLPGAGRSSRLTYFRHAVSQARTPPRGPDLGRSIRQCHFPVWPWLFCAATPSENYRRGSCYHRHVWCLWGYGKGTTYQTLFAFAAAKWSITPTR